MLHGNVGNTVPSRFCNIGEIRSIELRTHLSNTVSALSNLIAETKDFEMDDLNKSRLDRFFSYLAKSCENPSLINKRGYWLMIYGSEVLRHMTIFRNRHVVFDSSEICTEREELSSKVTVLVELIGEIQTAHPPKDISHGEMIIDHLDDIVRNINDNGPLQRPHYYSTIINDVERMTSFYRAIARQNGALSYDISLNLLLALNKLSHKIRHYKTCRQLVN